jgi:hypothetical protein
VPDLTYSQSVQPEELPGRAIPRLGEGAPPSAFGAGVGQAIESASQIPQHIYDQAQASQKAAQAQAQQTQLTDAHNQLQMLSLQTTHDPQTGAFTKQGKAAFGLNDQYLPGFDQQAQKIIQGVPDDQARQAAGQAYQQVRGHLIEQLDSHELQQHQEFATQTAQDGIKIAAQAMSANYNNPNILATNRDSINANLEDLAKQKGWDQDSPQFQLAKQEIFSKAHSDVIDRMLTDDKPQLAEQYLQAHKVEMDANSAWGAQKTIEAHIKEKQNDQKQDIADRYQDSLEAAQYGLPGAIRVTRGEMSVLYPKDAQRHWDELQIYQRAGAQAKLYDKMTPQEIEADLKTQQPNEGGTEALFNIKAYDALKTAAQRSLQTRASDPAQFAQTRGAWSPINFGNQSQALQELQTRAKTQSEVSQQIGVPVPLVSKGEARQLSGALDNSDPKQRLGLLNSLHDGLGNEQAYFSLLHEIAPNSPVTAIVGANVGTPKPADRPIWYNEKYQRSPMDAQRILTGEALLNPKAVGENGKEPKSTFPMPPEGGPTGLRTNFGNAVGDMFRDRPDLGEAHYAAFRDAYAALLSEKGDMKATLDPKLVKQAVQMSVGSTAPFNGGKYSVPSGMDPSMFQSAVEQSVGAMAKSSGAPADWAYRIKGYGLQELGAVGSGRYQLVNGNAPLVRPDGKPFQIDLRGQYKPKFSNDENPADGTH